MQTKNLEIDMAHGSFIRYKTILMSIMYIQKGFKRIHLRRESGNKLI